MPILCFFAFCTFLYSQAETFCSPSEGFPFQVSIIMDGGTFFICQIAKGQQNVKGHPDLLLYYFDGKMESKTRGEFFSGSPEKNEQENPQKLSLEDAEKVFEQFKEALIKFHGKEKLDDIIANLVDLDKITKKQIHNPNFKDRIITQLLCQHVRDYSIKCMTDTALLCAEKEHFGKLICVYSSPDFYFSDTGYDVTAEPTFANDYSDSLDAKVHAYIKKHEDVLKKNHAWLVVMSDTDKSKFLAVSVSFQSASKHEILWSEDLDK